MEKKEMYESTSHIYPTQHIPNKTTESKPREKFYWLQSYEKSIRENEEKQKQQKLPNKSSKYDEYFDTVESYGYSLGSSFNSVAYGQTTNYMNKNDFNFREYGSRFGSSVVCDNYDE